MHKYHRAHRYFKHRLDNNDQRISVGILGIPIQEVNYRYPDIKARFAPYKKWLDEDGVYSVKYEDLISKGRDKVLQEMIDFYSEKAGMSFEKENVLNRVIKNIFFFFLHTFRTGKSGNWKTLFNERHKRLMKKVAGDLLIELGYEENYDW